MGKHGAVLAGMDRFNLAGHSFVLVWDFMGQELGLKGADLAVYARIFGFYNSGKVFYETKSGTAKFFGLTERAVFDAIKRLKASALIEEIPPCEEAIRIGSKCYRPVPEILKDIGITPSAHEEFADEETSPHEEASGLSPSEHEGTSCQTSSCHEEGSGDDLKAVHPIPKRSNKYFE